MIGVPVNPNSVYIPIVQIIYKLDVVNQNLIQHMQYILMVLLIKMIFRQSTNNINHRISSNKILIILAIAYGLIIVAGIVFFIVSGITNINSDRHGFPILVGIVIALTIIGSIVFGSGCCLIQSRCVARLRQAIATESIQYSSKSPIACSWRLDISRTWFGTYGCHHYNNQLVYHILKYLGLLAMSKILRTQSKSVQVTREALIDIAHKLMIHMDKSERSLYRDELLSKIIEICSQTDYQHITNFECILVELTRLESTKHDNLISLQMLDVVAILPENDYVLIHDSNSTTVSEVLYTTAWICSGFCSSKFLDLDGWINDPQLDSEDESITTSSYYDNKGLFYDDNGENSNSNSYSGDTLNYQKSKKYIEPTAEELEKQRE
ncbi:unnamed protein product [Rotaria sordida]|uniref:Uncharacterized protein n=1 Tax=Rotaria sordida TaxID=392033 RepID=A0A815D6X1_9BILA|nr:unnamed protein product [Rotaria sordida]CAF1566141.1 unnamed protein product [Rotaria sordida]